jgi:hypothetical protein
MDRSDWWNDPTSSEVSYVGPMINHYKLPRPGLQQTGGQQRYEPPVLPEAEFAPKHLALETPRRLRKDWKILWTSDINEHVWVQKDEICLYWPSTTLFQQPR